MLKFFKTTKSKHVQNLKIGSIKWKNVKITAYKRCVFVLWLSPGLLWISIIVNEVYPLEQFANWKPWLIEMDDKPGVFPFLNMDEIVIFQSDTLTYQR